MLHDDARLGADDADAGEVEISGLLEVTLLLGLAGAVTALLLGWLVLGDATAAPTLTLAALMASISLGAAIALVVGAAGRRRGRPRQTLLG